MWRDLPSLVHDWPSRGVIGHPGLVIGRPGLVIGRPGV